MKRKKEDFFVIVVGAILVVIILIIAVITTNYSNSQEQDTTPNQTASPTQPLPTQNSTRTRPPLLYDPAAQDKLLDRIQNRKELSDDDRLAKAKVLSNIQGGKPSGIVYESANIIIDYTKSADVIQVEILTTNIQAAKNEANLWLRTQGLSQEAICDLPVGFYLNYDIASQLRKTDIVFSPLANGCE